MTAAKICPNCTAPLRLYDVPRAEFKEYEWGTHLLFEFVLAFIFLLLFALFIPLDVIGYRSDWRLRDRDGSLSWNVSTSTARCNRSPRPVLLREVFPPL
jgi:hypothetical protein